MVDALVGWNELGVCPFFPFSIFFLFNRASERGAEVLRQRKYLPGLNQRQMRWEAHQWSRKPGIYYFSWAKG